MLKSVSRLMGMEMVLVACEKEVALSPSEPFDILNAACRDAPRALTDAERRGPLRFTLAAKPQAAAPRLPESPEQTVDRDAAARVQTVTVRTVAPPEGVAFPYAGDAPDACEALEATAWIESDADAIRALARRAVGETTAAAEAARKIRDFVAGYIDAKGLSVGYASALEVARNRAGDCTEHAVLAVALCRAAGLPARMAVGLAYAETFAGRDHVFVPHAWFQVYLGGSWHAYDAALERFDAAHLLLATGDGDPLAFFGMVDALSKLRLVRVESAEAAP
jgi:hypothetical protein